MSKEIVSDNHISPDETKIMEQEIAELKQEIEYRTRYVSEYFTGPAVNTAIEKYCKRKKCHSIRVEDFFIWKVYTNPKFAIEVSVLPREGRTIDIRLSAYFPSEQELADLEKALEAKKKPARKNKVTPFISILQSIAKDSKGYLYDEFEKYRADAGVQDWMAELKGAPEEKKSYIDYIQREGWKQGHNLIALWAECQQSIERGKDFSAQITRGTGKDEKDSRVFFVKNHDGEVVFENENGEQWPYRNAEDYTSLMKKFDIPVIV